MSRAPQVTPPQQRSLALSRQLGPTAKRRSSKLARASRRRLSPLAKMGGKQPLLTPSEGQKIGFAVAFLSSVILLVGLLTGGIRFQRQGASVSVTIFDHRDMRRLAFSVSLRERPDLAVFTSDGVRYVPHLW